MKHKQVTNFGQLHFGILFKNTCALLYLSLFSKNLVKVSVGAINRMFENFYMGVHLTAPLVSVSIMFDVNK